MSIRRFLSIFAVSVFLIGTFATTQAFAKGWRYTLANHEKRIKRLERYVTYAGDHLHQHDCANGQVLKAENGSYICADDDNTDTLQDLANECQDGEVAKYNDPLERWECANDSGLTGWYLLAGEYVYYTITPLGSESVFVTCPSGQRAISGGFEISGTDHIVVRSSKPYTNVDPLDSWWVEIYNPDASDTVTPYLIVYAVCVDR